MSDRELREELAAIAREARRHVERERAAGGGELLALSAAKALARLADEADPGPGAASAPAVRGSEGSSSRSGARGASRSAEPSAAPAPAPASSAAPSATPAPAPASSAAPSATPAPAPASSAAPEPAASPQEFDLFGAPVAVARPAAPAAPLPPLHEPLYPAGRAAREALAADALPILEQVAGEARACRKCGLCETRTQAVPGVGSAQSGIVFVGEAPGADEDRRGEPFVGRAGEMLTRIIEAMDTKRLLPGVPLTRDTVYICNVLKCRPPENRNPLPHEIEMCSPYLRRQLDALKPRVICCLGKFAAELLLGVKGTIAGMRGRTYRYRGAKLIVTYHPAYCLRNPASKQQVWDDMKRLAQEYQTD